MRHVVCCEHGLQEQDGQDPIDVYPGQGFRERKATDRLTRYVSDLGQGISDNESVSDGKENWEK